jgi:septum formation protein
MSSDARIYLASRSPRRRELLTQIGVHFDMLLFRTPPREDDEIDESHHAGETPEVYVQRVALAKAEHAERMLGWRRQAHRLVLAADTTLDLDGEVIGKPRDENDAIAILGRLSGKTHRVLTAVVIGDGERAERGVSISEVRFRTLDADEIKRYVRSGEPMDKAGAYGIQGKAAMFIEEIRGSHSGIVGLPLCETVQLLRRFNFPV